MEHYKISKLLNDSTVSKFATKKRIEINDLSNDKHSVNKNLRLKTSVLSSDICEYSDAYIVVKVSINLLAAAAAEKNVAFKNNATFRSCISKISSTLIDDA